MLYFFKSYRQILPWSQCDNRWNDEFCINHNENHTSSLAKSFNKTKELTNHSIVIDLNFLKEVQNTSDINQIIDYVNNTILADLLDTYSEKEVQNSNNTNQKLHYKNTSVVTDLSLSDETLNSTNISQIVNYQLSDIYNATNLSYANRFASQQFFE